MLEAASESTWMPRHSGRDEAAGLVWLPRMIEKARRRLEGEVTGQDLLWPYMFGVNDPLDRQLLRFLGMKNEDVLEVLRHEPDDEAAAAEMVRRSGRTPAECAAWNARYLRFNAPFLAMMDADEARRPAGVSTSLLRWIYNHVIMAPSYPIYRRLERGGRTAGDVADEVAGSRTRQALLGAGIALAAVAVWLVWRRMSR
jgi:hypothetical protein